MMDINNGVYDGGRDPEGQKRKKHQRAKNIARAARLGQDILDYGDCIGSAEITSTTLPEASGFQPPKKKRKVERKRLLAKRVDKVRNQKNVMKIISEEKVNASHYKYKVAPTERSHTFLDVHISTQPSCSCKDYKNFGTDVHCQHIIFILLVGQGLSDLVILQNLCFSEDDVKTCYLAGEGRRRKQETQSQSEGLYSYYSLSFEVQQHFVFSFW